MAAKLLKAKDVAALLDVDGSTVRRWIADGHLPSIKTPGGQYRIDARVVDEWLARLNPEPPKAAA